MDTLPNELLVWILQFLDVKGALMFSATCSEYGRLVSQNSKVVRDCVTTKNDGTTKTVQITSIDGRAKVSKTREIAHVGKKGRKSIVSDTWCHCGSLFRGKRVGIWIEEKFKKGAKLFETRSFWEDGKLQYIHTRSNKWQIIALPREPKEKEELVRFEKNVLSVAFTMKLALHGCGGKSYRIFKDVEGREYSACCDEHRGELPFLLF
ncbi:hypothetical protein A9K97_gp430 [Tokyovirus A1]|uniref:hypothetical protein n=1 Tax=Tokyovirus A1 TaxID=1826170 RepID=UPI0007A96893|nr:hypothetical protein A9K97_gp430 [Tokyovirus A1]BAU79921.1 hypothetical protein [Tokyovirus A1]